MGNGHSDAASNVEQLRAELTRRKLGLASREAIESQLAISPGNFTGTNSQPHASSLNEAAGLPLGQQKVQALPENSQALRGAIAAREDPAESKPHLVRAKGALRRASTKSEVGQWWPRFLRGLRRNQAAVNESIIKAAQALLATTDWLNAKYAALDVRLGHQIDRAEKHGDLLAQLDLKVREQRLRSVVFEQEVTAQVAGLTEQNQLQDLGWKSLHDRFINITEEQATQLDKLTVSAAAYARETFRLTAAASLEQQRAITGLALQLQKNKEFHLEQSQRLLELQQQADKQRELFAALDLKLTDHQNEVRITHDLTTEAQEGIDRQLLEMQGFVQAQEAQTREEERQLETQQTSLAELHNAVLTLRSGASLDQEVTLMGERVSALGGSFAILRAHLLEKTLPPPSSKVGASLIADLEKHDTDAFYLAFENRFRGKREEIKERLRFYLPIISEGRADNSVSQAVDLGCGRGEWLELLRECDYAGSGVDLNICMVEECISRGLEAECSDAINYLKRLPAGSLSLVTGFHIVEHLPFAVLLDLFRETFRVLRPQGQAIFETPNPECAKVSMYSFFLDPTHRNPVPQELLCFLGNQAGFNETRVERLQPFVEEGILKGYLDYAGIFTK